MQWAELDNGMVEVKIFLKYKNGGEQNLSYSTKEGFQMYYKLMKNNDIYFGRLIEVYEDGEEIRRASFCHE